MSRWFRHYAGMMRDEKLVAVAIKAKQPVERVIWVWGAILESAAEMNDGGKFDIDAGEAAYFLRADEADIRSILDTLTASGRVAEGVVLHWSDRQYESDTSAQRQAAYRERKRAKRGNGDARETASDVTPPSRDGDVTPQETDTDTETNTERERENALAQDPKHWQEVQGYLKDRTDDLTDWEIDFLHSIKWAETLTKPQSDSLKTIRGKMQSTASSGQVVFIVKNGTPEFAAWIAHDKAKGLKTAFKENLREMTVPSLFPPEMEKAA